MKSRSSSGGLILALQALKPYRRRAMIRSGEGFQMRSGESRRAASPSRSKIKHKSKRAKAWVRSPRMPCEHGSRKTPRRQQPRSRVLESRRVKACWPNIRTSCLPSMHRSSMRQQMRVLYQSPASAPFPCVLDLGPSFSYIATDRQCEPQAALTERRHKRNGLFESLKA